jgi:cell division protein FtsB
MSKFLNLAKKILGSKNLKLLKSEKNLRIFRYLLILLIIILFVGNIIEINCNTTRGYEISKLQDKLAQLQDQQKTFNLEIANLKSLQSIEERVERLGMVPAGEVTYLAGSKEVAVAKK